LAYGAEQALPLTGTGTGYRKKEENEVSHVSPGNM